MEYIHNNIISFPYQDYSDTLDFGHSHKRKPFSKESNDKRYITSTDICTLLQYKDNFNTEKHSVIHRKYISDFYFNDLKLIIREK